MLEAVVVVVVAVGLVGVFFRGLAWSRRRRALRRIVGQTVVRRARGATVRVLQSGRVFPGMNPQRAHRTRADLVITADRFVLASGQGALVDLGPAQGRPLASARCTGPGKLVLEGDHPRPGGAPALYRLEVCLPDAEAWAQDLRPFVRSGSTARFGLRPPDA